jgi:hypothetical protein
LSKRIFTGLQPRRLGKLIAELAGDWTAGEESRLRERRENFDQTYMAVAGLVSDRAAER